MLSNDTKITNIPKVNAPSWSSAADKQDPSSDGQDNDPNVQYHEYDGHLIVTWFSCEIMFM